MSTITPHLDDHSSHIGGGRVEPPPTDCVCPPTCDCGPGGSLTCPEHNFDPWPANGCEAETHLNGGYW